MYILAINAGTLSLKFKVFKYSKKKNKAQVVLQGEISQIKTNPVILEIESQEPHIIDKYTLNLDTKNVYLSAIKQLYLNDQFNQYSASINYIINLLPYSYEGESSPIIRLHDTTISELIKNNKGPTWVKQQQHFNLQIAAHFIQLYSKCKHYGCFDNTFHNSIPLVYKTLINSKDNNPATNAHGLSFSYIANKLDSFVESKISKKRWLILHLGSRSSICGIKKHKSIITQDITSTISLSPYTSDDKNKLPNKKNAKSAQSLIEFYALEIAGYLSMYATNLGGLDGIVFTGGIGINDPVIRQLILTKLEWAGIAINRKANNKNKRLISDNSSFVKILLIKTNEELEMVNLLIKHKL